MREQREKQKNENRLPFYHFLFYVRTKENQGFGTGADTNHIVGGRFIGGGEGGVVLAKRIVVVGDENAARDLPALFFVSGSG